MAEDFSMRLERVPYLIQSKSQYFKGFSLLSCLSKKKGYLGLKVYYDLLYPLDIHKEDLPIISGNGGQIPT